MLTTLTATTEEAGTRIDSFLASHLAGVTRSAAQRLLEGGFVVCQGTALAKNYRLRGGETVAVTLPEAAETEVTAQNIPLDVVYED